MTVYFDKRREKWCYDFWRNKVRYAGYCLDEHGKPARSERAAEEVEKVEQRKVTTAAKVPSVAALTIAQAFADLTPTWELLPCWTNRHRYVKEIINFYGLDMRVADFDAGEVERYRAFCITRPLLVWKGGPHRDANDPANVGFWHPTKKTRGPNTANLYLGPLRMVLEHAGKLRNKATGEKVLADVPEVTEFAIPKRKARPVPEFVLQEILPSLPQHTVEATTLTLFFGFRRGEVFDLTIADVDFEDRGVRLRAEDVKDNEDAFMPASRQAMAYLHQLCEQANERGVLHLITWRPYRKDPDEQAKLPWRKLKKSKSAWRRVMDGIEAKYGRRWRWHDIRASFITHVARMSGQLAAQTLARHSEFETTKLYIEAANEWTREAADRAAERPALSVIYGGKSPRRTSQAAKLSTARTKRKS